MSVSATTAAKRRRAGNIVSSQLFKPTSAPIENSIQRRTAPQQIPQQQTLYAPQTRPNIQSQQQQQTLYAQQTRPNIQPQPQTLSTAQTRPNILPQPNVDIQQINYQKPMSLQQVISVFDKRLLYIESIIAKEQQLINGNINQVEQPSINNIQVQEMIQQYLHSHMSEFDHRYQMLATEIANLKQIVLKLQSYTLDVNKSLIEERIQILSDMKANVVIQPEDSLHLKEDLNRIEKPTENIYNSEETKENITFNISNNNDIKEELMQETSSTQILKETVQENNDDVLVETVECEDSEEENAEEEEEEENAETIECEEVIQENTFNSNNIITENVKQFMEPTEVNEEHVIKEQVNENLTQLSEELTQFIEEDAEKIEEDDQTQNKSKRKRKNKKSISINI